MARYIHVSVIILVLAITYYFARPYFAGCVCTSDVKLQGKTVIITGANSGIGKETALDLAQRGARVIMACRNMKKAEKVLNEIILKTGNKNVIAKNLDLASLKSVHDFAEDINTNEARLDILINNAGVAYFPVLTKTQDNFEMTMGVNHLGHFLLTNLLLDLLKKSAPSRIVVVASSAHQLLTSDFNFENINSELFYSAIDAYGQSKLANVLFSKELARRLKGSGVTVNSLHPGVITEAELLRHTPYIFQLLSFYFASPFCKTSWQGAQTSIHLAVSKDLSDTSGFYFMDCMITEPAKTVQDEKITMKLWDVSKTLVGLNSTI